MQVIKLFGVKAKWLLTLECILLCLVMTPAMNIAYDGMRLNTSIHRAFWSEYTYIKPKHST